MLRFAHPEYLWALWAIPALAVLFFFFHRWRKDLLARFIAESLFADLAPDLSVSKRVFKEALLLSALTLLIVAAANPQVGTRLEEVKREGIDVFVALDVSLSMKAEDVRPSRLEKAKRDVSSLLKKLQGDRVGLIVFAGDAFVQFPLTADYSAADLFISAVDVDAVPTPGTMIGTAIEQALNSFRKDLPTQKAIIIVSDGENTEGDVAGAIEKAKKEGVRVYTVGMGTPEGGPIPLYSNNVRTDYKRDRAGSIVLTKLDEATMQQIALISNGSYRRATSGGNEIDDIFKELSALEKTELGSLQVTGFEDQFQYPLALAIVLLIIENLLSERKGKMFSKLLKLVPIARALPLLFLFLGGAASGQTVRSHVKSGNEAYEKTKFTDAEIEYKKALEKEPTSKEAQFNLGNAHYKQQRFDEALRAYSNFAAAAKNPTEQAMALHNTGNSLFKTNKLPESLEAYKQALKLNPNDDDTRYNYQLAKERLKQNQNQQNKNSKQQNDKQQEDKKDQQQQQKDQQKDQQNQQRQEQQQKNQEAKQDQTKQQQAQQQKNQMPKEQADRILEALRNNEKEIQKHLRKREGVRIKVEKDW
ncbi:MAG: VWA domain-containing protein [Ignavibacteriales bacterium]|nr:VWA domain-containing protein [Ignavibacteriales bacterium]